MKRILLVALVLIIISTFAISSSATSEETYIYNFDSITVIFDEQDTWAADVREAIAHRLVYGEDNNSSTTYNILCNLFGHKYETKTVTTVTHCVLNEQPRCLEEHFNISLCSRCDESLIERTGAFYITCCP